MANTKPTNTALQDPVLLLAQMAFGGVEAIEAAGQQELVRGSSLPSDIQRKDQWESLGFEFGHPFPEDPLFTPVTMPSGWKMAATEHDMWSNIVDGLGCVRGKVFYKAAPYDRRARLEAPSCRYHIQHEYKVETEHAYSVVDTEDGSVIQQLKSPLVSQAPRTEWSEEEVRKNYSIQDETQLEAEVWLDQNYPGWRSPSAHWSEGGV